MTLKKKMTQIFFPSTPEKKNQQLYCYINHLSKVVIVRLLGLKDRHCERVIFPGEKFFFEANDNCQIEVSQQTNIGIIQDIIDCSQLKLRDN